MVQRTPSAAACACVAIVEDDPALSGTIADLLRFEGYEVATFTSGEAFLADGALHDDFGCAILDLRLPGISGLDVLALLRQEDSPLSVLVLTGHSDVAHAVEAMKLGAIDFLEKPYSPNALLDALARACSRSFQLRASQQINRSATAMVGALTARQRQVLSGIARGLSSKAIAHQLDLSVRTVEMHRAQMLSRLGVRTTVEAVRLALDAGLQHAAEPRRAARSVGGRESGFAGRS
jgi:two-component system response regulator FixJ